MTVPRVSPPAWDDLGASGNSDRSAGSRPVSPDRGDAPLPLPLPELDPETLRCGLRDFLQELRDAQRDRVRTGPGRFISPSACGLDETLFPERPDLD